MKIKSVCDMTGLSDRTIRYYIEQNLIAPAYTENYLGRKTFDFSHKDVDALKDIAVLRKFEFTIDEIREIIVNADSSRAIIIAVKQRTESDALKAQEKLSRLLQISTERAYTLAELAEALSQPAMELSVCSEKVERNLVKEILSVGKAVLVFLIVWLPMIVSLFAVAVSMSEFYYPVFEPKFVVLTLVSFIPSFGVLIFSRANVSWKRAARPILLALCVLSIPMSSFMSLSIVSQSETTNFVFYRDFDAQCLANRNMVFQELFPTWPRYFENVKQPDGSYETVYLDANYYYRYRQILDYTYDIYAEWPLEEQAFYEEVERASAVLHKAREQGTYGYRFAEIEKGKFTCLILYRGDAPFQQATNSYDYLIFAYDEDKKVVRYICCCSLENGADQPYYLQLDW